MKTSQVFVSSLSILFSLNLVGCSAKVTAEAPPANNPTPQGGGFDISKANGNWTTGCYIEKSGIASQTDLKLTDGNFEISIKYYNSNVCKDSDIQFSWANKGIAKIQQESSTESGSYEVDLRVDQGNGVTSIEKDLLRFENNKLYLGDQSVPKNGDYPSKVDRLKVLTK